jgi:hypothetical protein
LAMCATLGALIIRRAEVRALPGPLTKGPRVTRAEEPGAATSGSLVSVRPSVLEVL